MRWYLKPFSRLSLWQRLVFLLKSEHAGDALRNTLATLVPPMVVYWISGLEVAVYLGVGTLLSSLSDFSGNRQDKRRSAYWCIPLFFVIAILVSWVAVYPLPILVLLSFFAFFTTMLSSLGTREGAVGAMALILGAFTLGLRPEYPLEYSVWVAVGAAWYYAVSLIQVYVDPYRSMRYSMSGCLRETAKLLRAKALCYNESNDLASAYKKVSLHHIGVSSQQEAARLLLLRDRELEDAIRGRTGYWFTHLLHLTDLYEQLTAVDHDYDMIRNALAPSGLLVRVQSVIDALAAELDFLSWQYIKRSKSLSREFSSIPLYDELEALCVHLDRQQGDTKRIGLDVYRNMEAIVHCINGMRAAFDIDARELDQHASYKYSQFATVSVSTLHSFFSLFTFKSNAFVFAVRMAFLFLLGGVVGLYSHDPAFAYWILLTIAIVARPTFAVTQEKNTQRLLGTGWGLILGFSLFLIVESLTAQLLFASFFLFGYFLFVRVNYTLSIVLLTPAIVFALHVDEGNFSGLLGSRIIFTVIGCVLAVLGWFILPVRQRASVPKLANDIVEKNRAYLQQIKARIVGEEVNVYDIRLLRKQVHTALSGFSEALFQLHKEPGARRSSWEDLYEFNALAYRVNAQSIAFALSTATEDVNNADIRERFVDRISSLDKALVELEELASRFSERKEAI